MLKYLERHGMWLAHQEEYGETLILILERESGHEWVDLVVRQI